MRKLEKENAFRSTNNKASELATFNYIFNPIATVSVSFDLIVINSVGIVLQFMTICQSFPEAHSMFERVPNSSIDCFIVTSTSIRKFQITNEVSTNLFTGEKNTLYLVQFPFKDFAVY